MTLTSVGTAVGGVTAEPASTINLTLPTGIQVGDFLVLVMERTGVVPTAITTGIVQYNNVQYTTQTNGYSNFMTTFTKTLDATDVANGYVQFNNSGSTREICYASHCFRATGGKTPYIVSANNTQTDPTVAGTTYKEPVVATATQPSITVAALGPRCSSGTGAGLTVNGPTPAQLTNAPGAVHGTALSTYEVSQASAGANTTQGPGASPNASLVVDGTMIAQVFQIATH